jgi:hypothetical protein
MSFRDAEVRVEKSVAFRFPAERHLSVVFRTSHERYEKVGMLGRRSADRRLGCPYNEPLGIDTPIRALVHDRRHATSRRH